MAKKQQSGSFEVFVLGWVMLSAIFSMYLSGSTIKRAVEAGEIIITPFNEAHLKGASYTFTLGNKLLFLEKDQILRSDSKPVYSEKLMSDEGYVLQPGEFVLGYTAESLKLGGAHACTLSARGSCAQIGLHVFLGSNFAEPDTDGPLILEIANNGPLPIQIFPGMLIVKGIFAAVV